jgi:hypothetical protein
VEWHSHGLLGFLPSPCTSPIQGLYFLKERFNLNNSNKNKKTDDNFFFTTSFRERKRNTL